MPDPTSDGHLTPRTYALVRALQQGGLTGDGMICFGQRPSNPSSDHPKGRACDVFFDPHDREAVAQGWQVANWLIEHQATYGVHYIIWQGKFWSAYDPQWVTYSSSAYGCPNPASLTGCHMDHVHWSRPSLKKRPSTRQFVVDLEITMGPMQFLAPTWREVRGKHPDVGPDVYSARHSIQGAAHFTDRSIGCS